MDTKLVLSMDPSLLVKDYVLVYKSAFRVRLFLGSVCVGGGACDWVQLEFGLIVFLLMLCNAIMQCYHDCLSANALGTVIGWHNCRKGAPGWHSCRQGVLGPLW